VFLPFDVAELVGGEGGLADVEIGEVEMGMPEEPVAGGGVVDEVK